jgi:radical SAM superfamily enzyme YgiQ (UPF0313 family)
MEKVKLIGISVRSFIQYPYSLALAKMLKLFFPDIRICLGGCYITLSTHDFPPYISFIVKGDGGDPICHLADHIINQVPYNHNMPGLYKIGESSGVSRRKMNQEPADNEEIPDFSGIDLSQYLSYYLHPLLATGRERPDKPYLTFDYRTSMGCSNKCSFCTNRKVNTLRLKSAQKVIEDLKSLKQLYLKPNDKLYISFSDSSLNNSSSHVNDVLDTIIENKINMEWFAYVKVHNMTTGLLEKFARAGCRVLFWGIEALTQRMLDFYNKRFQHKLFQPLFQKAMELKIMNVISLIYNGPHETEEDFNIIMQFVEEYSQYKPLFLPNLSQFTLFQNSDIYNDPGKYGIEVLKGESDLYSSIRPSFEWKEIGTDINQLKQQRKIRKERVDRFILRYWGRKLG